MYKLSRYIASHQRYVASTLTTYEFPRKTASLLFSENDNDHAADLIIHRPLLFLNNKVLLSCMTDALHWKNLVKNTSVSINTPDIRVTDRIGLKLGDGSRVRKLVQYFVKASHIKDNFGVYEALNDHENLFFNELIVERGYDLNYLKMIDFDRIRSMHVYTSDTPIKTIDKINNLNVLLPKRVTVHKTYQDGDLKSFNHDENIKVVYHFGTQRASKLAAILEDVKNTPYLMIKKLINDNNDDFKFLELFAWSGFVKAKEVLQMK